MKNIKLNAFLFVLMCLTHLAYGKGNKNTSRPNVVIVITDDQGYGELGCSGNDLIQTPNIDQFYKESVHFTNFHVSPTCAPSRAALFTGRYTNRTGCWHTIAGRSQLFEDEVIMAQVFQENEYATGLFGKWHLGDNHPFRPEDRGFQEVLSHGAGGIGQGPDYWGNDYFDDTYRHNGRDEKYEGYCTDVFFDNALQFIEKNKEKPFFCYISTNAPHAPLNVPQKYLDIYEEEDRLLPKHKRFYAMVSNIDDNFKLLTDKLEELGLSDNTIVIFMTDNGSASTGNQRTVQGKVYGFNYGFRGHKGSAYEGGHRVPFFMRWPEKGYDTGTDINTLTAHIDVMPTLIEMCGLDYEARNEFDGHSFLSLLNGKSENWQNRSIIVDSQRLQNLVKWRKSAVMDEEWRLVDGKELYQINEDSSQSHNVAKRYPKVVERMRKEYLAWWESLLQERVNEKYAYIKIGTQLENPVKINAHDMHSGMLEKAWHQMGALKASQARGVYKVDVTREGLYRFCLCRYPRESKFAINAIIKAQKNTNEIQSALPASHNVNMTEARLCIADKFQSKKVENGDQEVVFEVKLQRGKFDLETVLLDELGRSYPAYYTYIEKLED
jgi:arylsulfatase A-like enzyme